jgi:hypothetical protein
MLGSDLTQRSPNRAIMQYGDTYGYLQGDKLLILQPKAAAKQFRYTLGNPVLQQQASVDAPLAQVALAHALWPSWAYFNQRYTLPPLHQK